MVLGIECPGGAALLIAEPFLQPWLVVSETESHREAQASFKALIFLS